METETNRNRATALSHSHTRMRRFWAVIAAVSAAVVSWAAIEFLVGVDLRAPAFNDSTGSGDIDLTAVVGASLAASLTAWALLAVLEHFATQARQIWIILTLAGLLLSLAGPLSGSGIDSEDRALLVVLHLVVAAVLIPLLYRTAAQPKEARR